MLFILLKPISIENIFCINNKKGGGINFINVVVMFLMVKRSCLAGDL